MNTLTFMCEDIGKKSFFRQAKQNNDVQQETDRDSHIKTEISLR